MPAMDRNAFAADNPALELRVLEGPQAGARAPLSGTCVLAVADAEDDEADLLLHAGGASAVRVRIAAAGGHALLEVLEGTAELAGQTLEAGRVTPWPQRAPLRLGRTLVAFGPAGQAGWDAETDMETDTGADADSGPETPRSAPAALPGGQPARAGKRPSRRTAWLLPVGLLATLGGLAVLTLALVHGSSTEAKAAVKPPSLAEALQGGEFASLTVVHDAAGQAEIRGRLATLAQRGRLEALLAARQLTPALQVQVDEGLARDVTDTFRLNGVAVQARVTDAGEVAVEASEPDAQRLERAQEVVRRDVRGLKALSVANRAKPTPPPMPPVPDDPGKRIASLVPGDPAYLVTADGSRYFVGAMLPTGHRITRIDGQHVTLERGGEASTLNF
jgi:type III secretion protein D